MKIECNSGPHKNAMNIAGRLSESASASVRISDESILENYPKQNSKQLKMWTSIDDSAIKNMTKNSMEKTESTSVARMCQFRTKGDDVSTQIMSSETHKHNCQDMSPWHQLKFVMVFSWIVCLLFCVRSFHFQKIISSYRLVSILLSLLSCRPTAHLSFSGSIKSETTAVVNIRMNSFLLFYGRNNHWKCIDLCVFSFVDVFVSPPEHSILKRIRLFVAQISREIYKINFFFFSLLKTQKWSEVRTHSHEFNYTTQWFVMCVFIVAFDRPKLWNVRKKQK